MSTQAAVFEPVTSQILRSPEPVEQSGAYAIIPDRDGRVLTLEAENGRTYLPGGRIEPGETPRQALIREIVEECGWEAEVGAPLGRSSQAILSGTVHLQASYWRAQLSRPETASAEHRLVWMDPAAALRRLHRPGDRKAVLMAFPASVVVSADF